MNDDSPTLNFRVDHIEDAIQDVLDNQGTVTAEIQTYPYGKFAQFVDPFGNKIELWEADVEYYKKMVNGEVTIDE